MPAALLLCGLALAGAARAQEAPRPDGGLPSLGAGPRRGWVQGPASLVLYDSSGTLVAEIGVGSWKDRLGAGAERLHTQRAGASGCCAWAWERVKTSPGGSAASVELSRRLRYLGTDGQELWQDESADAAPGVDPAALSKDGEVALVSQRAADGWTAAAYSFTGNTLLRARGPGPPDLLLLSPGGRWGLVRWRPLDKPPRLTFLDLGARKAREAPAGTLPPDLGIDDEGRLLSGGAPARALP